MTVTTVTMAAATAKIRVTTNRILRMIASGTTKIMIAADMDMAITIITIIIMIVTVTGTTIDSRFNLSSGLSKMRHNSSGIRR